MVFFPAEVLYLIFADLSVDELNTCMTVCKSWYSGASALQYKTLYWSTNYTERHVQLVTLTRVDGSKLGDFARRICFYEPCINVNFTADNFQLLMRSLPQLKVLDMVSSFLPFLNVVPRHNLPHVQEISLNHCSRKQRDIDNHFLLNIRYKDQIRTLKLHTMSLSAIGAVFEGLLTILSDFKILQHLHINCRDEHELDTRKQCINVTTLINSCSSLVSLTLESSNSWPISEGYNVVNTNLVSLTLTLSDFNEKHMEYMMQHVPNLEYFKLQILRQRLESMLASVNPAVLSKFTTYCKKLTYLELHSPLNTISRSEDVDVLSAPAQAFWFFLHNLSDGNCIHTLNAKALSNVINRSYEGARITKANQDIQVQCNLVFSSPNQILPLDKLQNLTWKTIHISVAAPEELNSLYTRLMKPIFEVLKQQDQICSLNISGQISFYVQPKRPAKPISRYGHIRNVMVSNELLMDLAELYPFVTDLVLENCTLEKYGDMSHINLSYFPKISRLTFDLDKVVVKPTGYQTYDRWEPVLCQYGALIYIQLINVMAPQTSEFYSITGSADKDITYLGNSKEIALPPSAHLVKIHHKQIEHFVFKRRQTIVFL